eukprot:TRINITY_DN69119_c0_g1_i1.p1 TRINITY_DN69119_c0_g1~~TRINITY_DN69119_c0_g1_i1.p1  ORF type:complete len:526 (+),score=81.03 TRINITY_DN69119_c0_g1_i1:58-1635(+)
MGCKASKVCAPCPPLVAVCEGLCKDPSCAKCNAVLGCVDSSGKADPIDRKVIPMEILDFMALFKDRLIAQEGSIPCELTGDFHSNWSGSIRGFSSVENKHQWMSEHIRRAEERGGDILEYWTELSADWCLQYGPMNGFELPPYRKLQNRIWAVQGEQEKMYREELAKQRESEIAAIMEFGQSWPDGSPQELKQRCEQPIEATTLRMTYNTGYTRIEPLFRFASTLAEIVGLEAPIQWNVKRPARTWHKIISRSPVEFAQSNFRNCADVIRCGMAFTRLCQISQVLDILKELGRDISEERRSEVLRSINLDPDVHGEQQPGPFAGVHLVVERIKNRFARPCLGGYRDAVVSIRINGYVCELQLHLRCLLEMKGDHGRELHKWMKAYSREFDEYIGDRTEDGVMDGNGMHWIAGGLYEGQFVDGKRHGKGTFYYATGDRYEGEFVNGTKHGQGTYCFATGDRYKGTFCEDEMTGVGSYYNFDGGRYEGEHLAGRRHGKGTYYAADGTSTEAEWVDNNRVKVAELTNE